MLYSKINSIVWRSTLNVLHGVAVGLLVMVPLGFLMLKASYIHTEFLRYHVGTRTFMLLRNVPVGDQSGGGTGFLVKAPSGKTFMITNDHVCVGTTGGIMHASNDYTTYDAQIIERSQKTDLCVLTAPSDYSDGLSFASEIYRGEQVRAVGYPKLMPLTMSNVGDIIYTGETTFSDKVSAPAQFSPAKCDIANPKYSIFRDGNNIETCNIYIPEAMWMNILVRHGSSGSPIVNFYGNVAGIVAAKDESDWGVGLPFYEIKDFLSNR